MPLVAREQPSPSPWQGTAGHGGHSAWAASGRGSWLTLDWQKNPTILIFLFKQRMLSSKTPCYLGAQDFMPIPGEAHHFLTQDLRIWHLYCRRRDSFAPERQVNNCSVLSSPWRGCVLLKQPRHCCQALHYCLLSPKVSNAPALPTAGLPQGWMRHFPGQDFMNETDCVLQGKRLLCISRRRKPMWRLHPSFSSNVEEKSTSLTRFCQKASPLVTIQWVDDRFKGQAYKSAGQGRFQRTNRCSSEVVGRGAHCWTILIDRKSGALLWVWQLQNMAGLQVIFGWSIMTHGSATENVWSWRQSLSKITSERSDVSYPESGRPNRSTPFWAPRVSLRRPWHQLQSVNTFLYFWCTCNLGAATVLFCVFLPHYGWRKVNKCVLCITFMLPLFS